MMMICFCGSVGLACHVDRPFIVTSCSRDSTLRVWSIARIIQPLEINILCSRPWKEIVISPGTHVSYVVVVYVRNVLLNSIAL